MLVNADFPLTTFTADDDNGGVRAVVTQLWEPGPFLNIRKDVFS